MNEPTGFCSGECPKGVTPPAPSVVEETKTILKRFLEAYNLTTDESGWYKSYD